MENETSPWSVPDAGGGPFPQPASAPAPSAAAGRSSADLPPVVGLTRIDEPTPNLGGLHLCSIPLCISPSQPLFRLQPQQRLWFNVGLAVHVPPGYIGLVGSPLCPSPLDARVLSVEPSFVAHGNCQPVRVMLRNTGAEVALIPANLHVAQMVLARLAPVVRTVDTSGWHHKEEKT